MAQVERVDRAVAFGDRHQQLAADDDLDHRLGDRYLLAVRVVTALDAGAVALDVEEVRNVPSMRRARIAKEASAPS